VVAGSILFTPNAVIFDPDPNPNPDPDPLVRGMDPRIQIRFRIHTKMPAYGTSNFEIVFALLNKILPIF
jgi:hypothetical protein